VELNYIVGLSETGKCFGEQFRMALQDRCSFHYLICLKIHGINFPELLVTESDGMMWL
jgi:hypothetical protein